MNRRLPQFIFFIVMPRRQRDKRDLWINRCLEQAGVI